MTRGEWLYHYRIAPGLFFCGVIFLLLVDHPSNLLGVLLMVPEMLEQVFGREW